MSAAAWRRADHALPSFACSTWLPSLALLGCRVTVPTAIMGANLDAILAYFQEVQGEELGEEMFLELLDMCAQGHQPSLSQVDHLSACLGHTAEVKAALWPAQTSMVAAVQLCPGPAIHGCLTVQSKLPQTGPAVRAVIPSPGACSAYATASAKPAVLLCLLCSQLEGQKPASPQWQQQQSPHHMQLRLKGFLGPRAGPAAAGRSAESMGRWCVKQCGL